MGTSAARTELTRENLPYTSSLTDAEWALIAPLLPEHSASGVRGAGRCGRSLTASSTCCVPSAHGGICRWTSRLGLRFTAGSCACRRRACSGARLTPSDARAGCARSGRGATGCDGHRHRARVAADHLFEQGDGTKAGGGLQQRHDLGLQDLGQGIGPPRPRWTFFRDGRRGSCSMRSAVAGLKPALATAERRGAV